MANGSAPTVGKALTAAFVQAVKQPGKYHDGKGTGLYLRVEPNGSRFWVQRITIRGKRRELGLGSPPTVTLAGAREAALDNKRIARAGGDPLAAKRKARAVLTFAEAARKAHAELSPTWKNPKDRAAFDQMSGPLSGMVEHSLGAIGPLLAAEAGRPADDVAVPASRGRFATRPTTPLRASATSCLASTIAV